MIGIERVRHFYNLRHASHYTNKAQCWRMSLKRDTYGSALYETPHKAATLQRLLSCPGTTCDQVPHESNHRE